MQMLEEALSSAGKRDVYEAFYFPAHAYQLGPKTQIYTTGLAILDAAVRCSMIRMSPSGEIR